LLINLAASRSSVQIGWIQPEIGNVVSFNVYRGLGTQTPELIFGVTGSSATDFNVQENETYCYQVTAVSPARLESERSDVLCVNTEDPNDPGGPTAPLPDWDVPDIGALQCVRELSSAMIQSGVTVISDDCVRVPETLIVGAGATLRISEGVVMIFGEGAKLIIPRDATITTNGTRESPVVMTGESSVPGFWGGVEFRNSTSRENLLRGGAQ